MSLHSFLFLFFPCFLPFTPSPIRIAKGKKKTKQEKKSQQKSTHTHTRTMERFVLTHLMALKLRIRLLMCHANTPHEKELITQLCVALYARIRLKARSVRRPAAVASKLIDEAWPAVFPRGRPERKKLGPSPLRQSLCAVELEVEEETEEVEEEKEEKGKGKGDGEGETDGELEVRYPPRPPPRRSAGPSPLRQSESLLEEPDFSQDNSAEDVADEEPLHLGAGEGLEGGPVEIRSGW
jgi:hypothetical protein